MFNGPVENASLRIIALGAGVQSSVMALMAAHGEIEPMPDAAIFADTQWEPDAVYEHLDWLEKELPFPVYRVSVGNIREMVMDTTMGIRTVNNEGKSIAASLPVHVEAVNELSASMLSRQCTNRFKIQPLTQEIRKLLKLEKGQRVPKETMVEKWIGISLDEIQRAKDSRDKWAIHRHPLIEKRLTRYACQLWFEEHYPQRQLTKSACIGCPYHDDRRWKDMKETDLKSWNDAVVFDRKLREGTQNAFGVKSASYLHRSLIALDQVDLSTEQDKGQTDMFGEECEGMCGV